MSWNGIFYNKLMESYNDKLNYGGVSGERLAARLAALSEIGLTADKGSNRPGYSLEEKQAKDMVAGWMEDAGLVVHHDEAGNVFGRLAGKHNHLPAILSGSHVDSVPNGGHFDGPLGVLAALEVAQAWKDKGYQPEKPYEVVIFSDEEGARFNGGFNGSEGMMGLGSLEEKMKLKDSEGVSFEEVLKKVGLSAAQYPEAKRAKETIEMFVEVHIEQGKRLEKQNLPCGIVTGIAGPCWLEVTFTGEAGHAGNTPMNDRRDALVAASEFITKISTLPSAVSDSAVATVGKLHVEPNGVNVIPGKVSLYVDIRDIHKEPRDKLIEKIKQTGEEIAANHGTTVAYYETMRVSPVPIEEKTQELMEEAIRSQGLTPSCLPSGAGHDAMVVGEEIPVAMLFTKSVNGVSHHPDEWSELSDCVQTVHVLKSFVEKLQQGE
ncbi:M20 family metallo-hydrolase [Oceanobacillus manasiensis]|uniref:M20 family metallo-hydrolase n=1 Tax=Oceanobacillus manasiensis TaxID=586413 RepID=UPI0005A67328|nr:M20 family metallo-hydrolase [Oceanobacillus manasiensis]